MARLDSRARESCAAFRPCASFLLTFGPLFGAFDGALPPRPHFAALLWIHPWFKSRITLAFRLQVLRARPEANGKTGKVCGSECRGFGYERTDDRDAKQICLELHHQIVNRGATVHAKRVERRYGFAVDGIEHIRDLKRDTFESCARDVSWFCVTTEADDEAASVRIPVRSSETDKCRHEDEASRIGYARS